MAKNNLHHVKTTAAPESSHATPLRGPRDRNDFPIVGIGASAGGLDACRKLVGAMPASSGMAFILVQHLDPTHESMMVDLLAGHTAMTILQAADGMPIEPDHLYTIPPGAYLSVGNGALHLSQPEAPHGARLPVDFLLRSLAEECGPRAICVILSGTGADGCLGLKAVKEKGGFVIAQDPGEAAYDGMPRSAIETGGVDMVLPVEKIPAALADAGMRKITVAKDSTIAKDGPGDWLPEIIALLRTKTAHNFTLYKHGTLERRIERRMGMAGIATDDKARYLEVLRSDESQLALLAKDLLINVTSFFRDAKVFELLEKTIVPDLIRTHTADRPLRVWIAGCSTGEEAYSLAMLFREQLAERRSNVALQVFASDVHPDAVTTAREGFYPKTIEQDVSPARLARFFSKEDFGYRVLPDLRSAVVFTVQDLLADPPFSRLDMVSCRNLFIYLSSEAQRKVVSLFHFALAENGILLLGSSETIGDTASRFKVISKPDRLYRRIGRTGQGELGFLIGAAESARTSPRRGQEQAPSRQTVLSTLCRKLVTEAYAPAAVLINRSHELLYSLGPTEQYLRVAPGHPTHDLLAMVPQIMRTKLRSAIQQAVKENARTVVTGGKTRDGDSISFSIDVQPVRNEGEDLLLVCFVDQPQRDQRGREQKTGRRVSLRDRPRVAELEQELAATRTELHGAIRSLEISGEEQKAINEEALSVNEEYQSTNEELVTSKEELQSLNEELTALNGQLQETLERQRTTSNDLQNVLYSTDVATIFLDAGLNIRFFTPATKSLFNVIPGDVGRPLSDLSLLATDGALLTDARTILDVPTPIEREIEAQNGAWYIRRILPYRTQDHGVEGVVITFTDITERKHVAKALEDAKAQAEQATVAKSRFLAAASHDLRQPLQTLALLQGLLAKTVKGEKAQQLLRRVDETTAAMSGMLNTLLDIKQIESGIVRPNIVSFPIDDLLDGLRDEFTYHAEAKALSLRAVPCVLTVRSDPRLLEQMIRNLLSNALKYTRQGRVLLGCRRHGKMLRIEVWDTGIGMPEQELQAIFEEYHQLDNPARERNRGLGLGLPIVQRLADLLGHRIQVHSRPGKGSVFTIEVMLSDETRQQVVWSGPGEKEKAAEGVYLTGTLLVVEDDPELRELLELSLRSEGHRVAAAFDGMTAIDTVASGFRPDFILADYNLPNGIDGLQVVTKLREALDAEVPVIILTGDISSGTLHEISLAKCLQLNKPVKLNELTQAIQRLLKSRSATNPCPPQNVTQGSGTPIIFVVDDDPDVRAGIRRVLEDDGMEIEDYATCEAFLESYRPGREACLLVDASLPGMSGIELLRKLSHSGHGLPAVMITGYGDVPTAVEAMKAGASDFIEKPVRSAELLACVERALEQSRDSGKLSAWRESAANHVAGLTLRQRQIMHLVLAGHPSKNIATDLGISQRTVENHRASIMKKTGSKSLPALARLALAATGNDSVAEMTD